MCGNGRKLMSKEESRNSLDGGCGKCAVLPAPVSTAGSLSAQPLALFIVGSIN